MVRFLQQWCGYSLTGDVREHALLFVFGAGGNGKSVFLNTVLGILGDYATTAGMDTFSASRSDRHPTDLAALRGARFVSASESEEGRPWAEARIKAMTGGDRIAARFMRRDFFSYRPQFKLTIVGNHKPVLRNVDEAARRRFNIVPFDHTPAQPDRQLEEKLKAEWPAILGWMILGCADWQQNGLLRAEKVVTATEAYFSEQDIFGQWLEDECTAEPGNHHRWEPTGDLFASWQRYARNAGGEPGSQNSFAENMTRRGFERKSMKVGKTIRVWLGINLDRPGQND
jgi:putative DNA primase/helicase